MTQREQKGIFKYKTSLHISSSKLKLRCMTTCRVISLVKRLCVRSLIILFSTRGQFHQHLRAHFLYEFWRQSQNITGKSCQKGLSYEKRARKMLMKSALGRNSYEKFVRRTLMKLTAGLTTFLRLVKHFEST